MAASAAARDFVNGTVRIVDVHIARDDDARVLRKGRQDGRTYRRVRRRSADGSLYKLVAIRVVHNLRIRGIPNLDGRICSRHIRFRDNHVSTRIYDYRGRAVQKEVAVIVVEWSHSVVEMSRFYPSHRNSVGDAGDLAAENWIRIALALCRESKGVVTRRHVNVGVV